MKESYADIQGLLKKICLEEHQWSVRADLRVVAMLSLLQEGYTKFCCFLASGTAERGTGITM